MKKNKQTTENKEIKLQIFKNHILLNKSYLEPKCYLNVELLYLE